MKSRSKRNLWNSIVVFALLVAMLISSSGGIMGSLATEEDISLLEEKKATLEVHVLSEGGYVEVSPTEGDTFTEDDTWVIDNNSNSYTGELDEDMLSPIKKEYTEGSAVSVVVAPEDGYTIGKVNLVSDGHKVDFTNNSSIELFGTNIITVSFKKDRVVSDVQDVVNEKDNESDDANIVPNDKELENGVNNSGEKSDEQKANEILKSSESDSVKDLAEEKKEDIAAEENENKEVAVKMSAMARASSVGSVEVTRPSGYEFIQEDVSGNPHIQAKNHWVTVNGKRKIAYCLERNYSSADGPIIVSTFESLLHWSIDGGFQVVKNQDIIALAQKYIVDDGYKMNGCSKTIRYLYVNCFVWWIEYGMGPNNMTLTGDDIPVKGNANQKALWREIYNKALDEWEDYTYTKSVYRLSSGGNTQALGVFDCEPAVGTASLTKKKAPNCEEIVQGNPNYSLEGGVFKVYSDANCTREVASFTTHADGSCDEVELVAGKYYVKEVTPPPGYWLSKQVKEINIEPGGTSKIEFIDYPKTDPINILLGKRDTETGAIIPQGGGKLKDAEFIVNFYTTVFNTKEDVKGNPARSWVFKTDVNGRIKLREDYKVEGEPLYIDPQTKLPCIPIGSITIQEKTPPEGYLKNEELFFRNWEQLKSMSVVPVEQVVNEIPVEEQVIRGDISIVKIDGNHGEDDDKLPPIEGAEFTITSKTKNEVVCKLVTDEHGLASTKDLPNRNPLGYLPYDTYIITETKTPEGYKPVEEFEIKLNQHEYNYKYNYLEDIPIESPLQIVKKDKETGKVIPLANTSFKVLNSNMEQISFNIRYPSNQLISEFKTDETGTVQLPERLDYGTYYIEEVQAPNGYLKGGRVQFEVSEHQNWSKPIVVEYSDDNAMGRVRLQKKDYDTNDNVANAEYKVYAREDIVTNDGTRRYERDQLVDTMVTGSNGIATSKPLYLGHYYVKESRTPNGYALNTETVYFELKYKNQLTPVVWVDKEQKDRPTEVIFHKYDIDGIDLKGVSYHVECIKGDGEDFDFVTGDGGLHTQKYIKQGVYKLTETKTLPGYVLNKNPKYFKVNDKGYIFECDENEKAVTNKTPVYTTTIGIENDYIKVDISKSDITGEKEVEGATLQVISKKDNEVKYEWVSSDKPYRINKLPVGDYILRETIPAPEYVRASDVEFSVKETGVVQKVQMKDKQLFVTKTDITGDKELKGAKLKVLDDQEELVDEWTSTDNPHPVSNLEVNKDYTLIEEIAPKGYVIATEIKFHVEDDFKIQTVQMKDKQVFVSKTDVTGDKELPGAIMSVTDKDGKTVDTWVSEKEQHAISGLKVNNTYVLHEVVAPEGYVIASDIEFFVDDNFKIQTVHMVDERVYVNKWAVKDSDANVAPPNLVVDGSEDELEEEGIDFDGDKSEGMDFEEKPIQAKSVSESGNTEDSIIVGDGDNTLIEPIKPKHESLFDKITGTIKDFFSGRKQLEGTKLQVVDLEGNVVDEWEQEDGRHAINGLIAGETYTLVEVEATKGYVTASPIRFTVVEDGENLTISMLDKQVLVSKSDITGEKELPGAELVVKDKDGNEVDKWVSTDKPHPVEGLKVGETYTLTEYTAPDGYLKAEDITFTVKDDFTIEHVKMLDDHTKLKVSKKDITNKKELPGAKLSIKNKDGKVIESWTSEKTPHYIEKLPVGKYTLIEDYAPLGYKKANAVKFEVKETGKVQRVTMYDKRETKGKRSYNRVQKLVQTGEGSMTYIGLLACFFGILVAVAYRRRKNS